MHTQLVDATLMQVMLALLCIKLVTWREQCGLNLCFEQCNTMQCNEMQAMQKLQCNSRHSNTMPSQQCSGVQVCCRLPPKLCCLWWLWGVRPQQCVSSCNQPTFIISSIWSTLHPASIWPVIQHGSAESGPHSITICPLLHVSSTTKPGTLLEWPCLWLSGYNSSAASIAGKAACLWRQYRHCIHLWAVWHSCLWRRHRGCSSLWPV